MPSLLAPPRRRAAVSQPARLRQPGQPTAVIGHMGAPREAPANSAAAFLAAHRLGADGIELDLIAVEPGRILVAHDPSVATGPDVLMLETLEHLLAEPPLATMPVLLDIKSRGTARALAAALIGAGLTPRAVVSTTDPQVLRRLSLAAPQATRSQTFPRTRGDWQRRPLARKLAPLWEPVAGAILPYAVRRAIQRHDLHAVTVNARLVTPALRTMTAARGIELIVWTVDDPATTRRMLELDVDAIITNDPALVLRLRDEHRQRDAEKRRTATGGW
ncbi:MAG: glycerophosphodiester phosphodiesterase [Patulibacter sp.]